MNRQAQRFGASLVLLAFFSIFLIENAGLLTKWIVCGLLRDSVCTDLAVRNAKLTGLAVGGFCSIVATATLALRRPDERDAAAGAVAGVVLAALVTVLKIFEVQDQHYPDLKMAAQSLYIYCIAAVGILSPFFLLSSRVIKSAGIRFFRRIPLGVFCAALIVFALNGFLDLNPVLKTWDSGEYILLTWATIILPVFWGMIITAPYSLLLRPWFKNDPRGQRCWLVWFAVFSIVFTVGYGAFFVPGSGGGKAVFDAKDSVVWVILLSVVLLLPATAAAAVSQLPGLFWLTLPLAGFAAVSLWLLSFSPLGAKDIFGEPGWLYARMALSALSTVLAGLCARSAVALDNRLKRIKRAGGR